MKLKNIAWLLISSAILPAAPLLRASNLPDLILPAGVGVNVHFTTGHEKDLDLIAAAGFKFIRMDFVWGGVEREKGKYDWSAYDDLTTQLAQRGMRAYFILDYSNPLYEQPVTGTNPITGAIEKHSIASPQHPESIAAFAAWAAAAVKHFEGSGVVWEIWNEPNISFWQPKPHVEHYTALALATCRAIRTADPSATIVAPASSGFPWEFLDVFFKSGALKYLDAVSVHPYRSPKQPPETASADYQRLRTLIEKYAPHDKKNLPIISGEWGYSSNIKGVSLEQQANFIARQQLSNLLNGVPISIWYDWKNDGDDPKENEHNFGTVTPDLTPKPAYTAIKILTHELAGCRLQQRFDTGNTNDFVLVFKNTQRQTKLAAWTIAGTNQVAVPIARTPAREFSFWDGAGRSGKIAVETGSALIPLDGAPKYINLNRGEIRF